MRIDVSVSEMKNGSFRYTVSTEKGVLTEGYRPTAREAQHAAEEDRWLYYRYCNVGAIPDAS